MVLLPLYCITRLNTNGTATAILYHTSQLQWYCNRYTVSHVSTPMVLQPLYCITSLNTNGTATGPASHLFSTREEPKTHWTAWPRRPHVACRAVLQLRILDMGSNLGEETNKLDDPTQTRGYWTLKQEAISHSVENSLWKRLRTCRKTDYVINQYSTTKCSYHTDKSCRRQYMCVII
jgi:hypothetical protein